MSPIAGKASLADVVPARVTPSGIGLRLVAIGSRVAQKVTPHSWTHSREQWGDDVVFVAVEADNEPAVELYRRSGFRRVLDETSLPHRSQDTPRRVFLCKSLESKS